MTYDEAFEKLLNDGTIYTPPKDAIFDFVNAILDRKVKKSFQLYQECLDVGEAIMVMLTVLYNNTKALLQVQTYRGNKITEGTGLTPWQIKCVKPFVNRYSVDELINLLMLIRKCDNGIKTGKIEEQYVMPYILIHTL